MSDADIPEYRLIESEKGEQNLPDFHHRLREIVDRYSSEAAFARKAGLSQSGINRLLKQKGYPTLPVLVAIAEAAEVSLDWLAYGRQSAGHEFVVKEKDGSYILRDACNSPGFIYISVNYIGGEFGYHPEPPVLFRESWLATVKHAPFNELFLVTVQGDGMSPEYCDGDLVLVDGSKKNHNVDGVYVLDMDGVPYVRRIQFFPSGKVRVLSRNPVYQDIDLDLSQGINNIRILGQAI